MPEIPRFSWRVLLVSTTVALLLAVVAGLIVSKVTDDHDSTSTVRPDQLDTLQLNQDKDPQPLDQVAFTTFDGKKVKLASLKGRPLVVNFFASYCTPCIKEMPALQDVYRRTGNRVQFLGLAVSDRISEARRLIARTKVTYPTAQDPDADVLTAVNAYNLPTTVLIDATGKVVDTHTGAVTSSELRSLLADKLGITT